jgi:RHS repeat-associated protein
MAGISSKALKTNYAENKQLFNGYEQQDEEFNDGDGLAWYDYKRRFYDYQIGRFFCQDGLADKYPYYSPYQFAGNEVPNAIDLDGLEPFRSNLGLAVKVQQGVKDFMQGKGAVYRGVDWFNRNINPVGMIVHGAGKATTGKDLLTGEAASRLQGVAEIGTGAMTLFTMFYGAAMSGQRGLTIGGSTASTEVRVAASSSDEMIESAFKVTAQEDDLIFYSTKVGDNVIEFGGNFSKVDDVLTIKNFDVDGDMTNKLGIKGIKSLMNAFGKEQGVKKVVIEGAKRTTGANPGKTPTLTFDIMQ